MAVLGVSAHGQLTRSPHQLTVGGHHTGSRRHMSAHGQLGRSPHQLTVGGHFNGGATGACAGGRLRPDWSHQSWAPGPAIENACF